jgi:CheY-like chemotaxis protein
MPPPALPELAAWLAHSGAASGSGEHRLPSARPATVKKTNGSRSTQNGQRRILLADADSQNRESLRSRLSPLASELCEATSGDELEKALMGDGPFHCVLASARLPEPSALQVLARVRRHGVRTPFIVVTSVHGNLLRIFVSDAEGTVLSSRMVDGGNLSMLVASLIEADA